MSSDTTEEMAPKPVYKKKKIHKALREQVWVDKIGKQFDSKCMTPWCKNTISVFDFQCGHDVPESRGGATKIENLVPICSRCNLSMSNQYTFSEWKNLGSPLPLVPIKTKKSWFGRFMGMFARSK